MAEFEKIDSNFEKSSTLSKILSKASHGTEKSLVKGRFCQCIILVPIVLF